MSEENGRKITQLLQQGGAGSGLSDELLPLIYSELRSLARSKMARERPGQTLQTTALIHEAYLRLLGKDVSWDSRGHFFSAAAEAMRRILIEQARRKSRIRHGGEQHRTGTPLDEIAFEMHDATDMLDLDAALTELEQLDTEMANVIKLRYFAGLTINETASALDVSARAVNRHWSAGRAWLTHKLNTRDQAGD